MGMKNGQGAKFSCFKFTIFPGSICVVLQRISPCFVSVIVWRIVFVDDVSEYFNHSGESITIRAAAHHGMANFSSWQEMKEMG